MLNLYKLNIFATVVEHGSFSSAADSVFMSQSAVSQHIQDLERSLGTKLFNRGRRGVTLTPSGETLYKYVEQILQLVNEAEHAVADVENLDSGQVNIGATPGISVYLLPEWIHVFRHNYPNVTASTMTGVTTDIVEGVLSRKLDIGFVEGELDAQTPDHLGQLVLQDIQLSVIIGQGHPCWNKDRIPPENLDGQPFINRQPHSHTRRWIDGILSIHNIKPRIVAELDNPESIKRAVTSGMGITILPEYTVQDELDSQILRALPLDGIPLQRSLKLIWDKRKPCTPIARAFLLQMVNRFPQLDAVIHPQ